MKLYSFYISEDDIRMMNDLNSFYQIEFEGFIGELPILKIDSSKNYYLYAASNDKEAAKSFEETHNMEVFVKSVKQIEENQYEYLCEKYPMCIISHYDFIDKNLNKFYIITTVLEECILYDIEERIEASLRILSEKYEYCGYKEKFIEALDFLMYCTYNQMNGLESEMYSYNYSFGITAEGYVKQQVKIHINIFKIYCSIFSHLLK